MQRIVDRLIAGICAFSPDPEQGVAANLHVYYKECIDFWCDDPEALSLIWYCLHLTNEALRSRLTEQSHRFNACMKDKTLEIIHTAHERVNVSDEELYSTMRVMYNHLLTKYMQRVVDLKAEAIRPEWSGSGKNFCIVTIGSSKFCFTAFWHKCFI